MRRTTCTNHLRQVGLSIQNYESSMRQLPSLYNAAFRANPPSALDEFHCYSWRATLLSRLEHSGMADKIDFSVAATDDANQSWVNTELAVFLCPSTSTPSQRVPEILRYNGGKPSSEIVGTAARSDYEIVGGAAASQPAGDRPPYLSNVAFGAWGEPTYRYERDSIVPVSYRIAKFRDITDGLSNTMLVAERAGRPDFYSNGELVEAWPYSGNLGSDNHQAAWAISTHFAWLAPHNGKVNYENMTGIYSFHSAGANCLFADGAVQLVSNSVDSDLLNAWSTRAKGESISRE
ncbi:DUF1559 domain-containing protein [Stieleria sp. JC731]|nr:DUF1559 domain-containing protein [Stieleria sp. JC731]